MTAKQDTHQRLAEIISELDNLARNLAQGSLQVGSHRVSIGPPFSFKLKQKLKDDVVSYDISFQLPVLGTDQGELRPEKPPARGPQIPAATTAPPSSSPADRPKKFLATLWKTVVRKVEGNTAIPQADAMQLRELAAGLYADKPWSGAWGNCRSKIEACLEAAARGDFTLARQLAAEVKELTRLCHKQYK